MTKPVGKHSKKDDAKVVSMMTKDDKNQKHALQHANMPSRDSSSEDAQLKNAEKKIDIANSEVLSRGGEELT